MGLNRPEGRIRVFRFKILFLKLEIIRTLLYGGDYVLGSKPFHLYMGIAATFDNVKPISLGIISLIMT